MRRDYNFREKNTFFKDKYYTMKSTRMFLLAAGLVVVFSSCSMFKPKYGCGTNGKNIGAEKFISGETPKKTPKFKA
jgi:hypothetical protein